MSEEAENDSEAEQLEHSENLYMLTTVDNPFNPHTHFDEWFAYDQMLGYNTSGFLARIAQTSDELSDPDQHQMIQAAIDEIVEENVTGLYRKVAAPS